MKKHQRKKKKVVVDVIDGKVITEPRALKISNVEEYIEKNGYKLVKIVSIIFLFSLLYQNVYAYDASYMTQLDLSLSTNIYILLAVIAFSITLLVIGFKYQNFTIFLLGCIILFFTGLVLLANGFNVVLSILMIIVPIILVWVGVGA